MYRDVSATKLGSDIFAMKLSVAVVTYNQRRFIAECMDSLIANQATMKYEIIVGDDASTDGTREIIREYHLRYPDLIKPIYQEANQYFSDHGNHRAVHAACKGEYIAHMDGDDVAYQGKFERQVRYLDEHPQCVVCHHAMDFIDADSRKPYFRKRTIYPHRREEVSLNDFIRATNCIYASSAMFRRDCLPREGLDYSSNYLILDYLWWAKLMAHSGKKVGYIAEVLGAYRRNVGVMTDLEQVGRAVNSVDRLYDIIIKESDVNEVDARCLRDNLYATYYVMGVMGGLHKKAEDSEMMQVLSNVARKSSCLWGKNKIVKYCPESTLRVAARLYRRFLTL